MKEEEMYKFIAWAIKDKLSGDESTDIEECDSDES